MKVISNRAFEHWPSWDLVYEWEDEIARSIPGTMVYKRKELKLGGKRLFKALRTKLGLDIDVLFLGECKTFFYDMSPQLGNFHAINNNQSVCIIDFYLESQKDLDRFYKAYQRAEHLYVSSKEVYDYLQKLCPQRPVEHLPLTFPDKYAICSETSFKKEYDLILQGRQNPLLLDWLHQYEKTHDITYVSRGKIEGNNFPYYTNRGDFIGYGNTREQYINLLRGSRVALYSTPGIDGDAKDGATNRFHQVTPRFLEEIGCGCNVIARYVPNSDTEYFELDKMTSRVETYQEFEIAMDKAIHTPPDMILYADYLQRHYTSEIAKILKKGL